MIIDHSVVFNSKSFFRLKHLILTALTRPFIMFAQEPILQLFGVYFAFVYGTIYRKSTIYYNTPKEIKTLIL